MRHHHRAPYELRLKGLVDHTFCHRGIKTLNLRRPSVENVRRGSSMRGLFSTRRPVVLDRLISCLFFLLAVVLLFCTNASVSAKKIAVIGGGISGTFATKYLTDYDPQCTLESLTIFEPYPVNDTIKASTFSAAAAAAQGSRVSTLELEDGTLVELGASVLYKGFFLVSDMIRNDGRLQIAPPFYSGKDDDGNLRSGMGIYTGNGAWALLTTVVPAALKGMQMLFRYSWDLVAVKKICTQAQEEFAMVPPMLESTNPETFFDSPEDIWQAVKLSKAVHSSFDQLLDVIGVSKERSWWRQYLPYQGSLRQELLTAINLVNYNQDNKQVNGIVGLGSFAAASGGLFSIKGGNYQIIRSAFEQAVKNRDASCPDKPGTVTQVTDRITTIIGGLEGLTLFAGDHEVGVYDIVILAAPLQMSRIQFLIPSNFDNSVLQPMPLAGLIDAHAPKDEDHEGHVLLPESVPESATRPYTQVVTTVVGNAILNTTFFGMEEAYLPRSILFTAEGKAATYNITGITQISSENGVYKVFSNDKLSNAALSLLFGSNHKVEYVEFWGGPHGGATPDYQGQGLATNFLLYDGATGFSGVTSSGALYYPVAMEQSSLASMETAATGAKAVAKLVAERVGLLEKRIEEELRDEL